MNISAFCIKHRVSTILAFLLISIFGLTLYSQLKLTLIPEMRYPAAFVSCYYNEIGRASSRERMYALDLMSWSAVKLDTKMSSMSQLRH